MDKIFIDTNILIYANDRKSLFHDISIITLSELSRTHDFVISTQTTREYAKFVTVTSAYEYALKGIKFIRNQFEILYENSEVFNYWLELMERYKIVGKLVFDCNIVATMLANNVKKLLTNNPKDFINFKNEIQIIPLIKE